MLLDEPTTFLDLRHTLEILELIADLNRTEGLTVVAVLHDLTLAAMYFHRIVFLKLGQLMVDGPPTVVITEETVRAIFDTDVAITIDADGLPIVRPRPRVRGRHSGPES